MKRRLLKWSLLLGAGLAGGALWLAVYALTPAGGSGTATVLIPKGAGVRDISRLLAEKQLISPDFRFLLLARLSGNGRRLRAGEFEVPFGLRPLQVLQILARGEVVRHLVTVPEGLTVAQIAALFAGQGWGDEAEFLARSKDPDFIRSLGLELDSLEGYLFPDTYSLVRDITDTDDILRTMVGRFFNVWNELQGQGIPSLDRHQVVTLASIVEKETGRAEERSRIAGVFFNRLHRGMRLQSDPTVIYGLPDFNGDLTRKDLLTVTPYNTYVINGLPPGPICNPGRAALEAVRNPSVHDALYFVAKNDGTHHFSRNLEEHNQAVRTYQKKNDNSAGQTDPASAPPPAAQSAK